MGKHDKTDRKGKNEADKNEEEESRVKKYTEEGRKVLVGASKAVLALPAGSSRDLYTAHPSFTKIMEHQATQVLQIISDVLKLQQTKGNFVRRDQEEKFELLQECNDAMLERINSNLDEMEGVKKKQETVLVETVLHVAPEPNYKPSGSWNDRHKHRGVKATLITGTNIARPQANFKVPVDNSALTPFVPKIKEKPNSLKPLAILPEYDDIGNIVSYLHPYEFELSRFEPLKEQLVKVEPQDPLPFDETPYDFIENEGQLNKLLEELREVKELAIDLEHHSYRTFQGFTCLMQISTRTKDYVVDALALREELHVLNEIFTSPKVVKVFHGAQSDIEWLQRDLSLYIVNMFDTGEAARILEFSRLGLQFLMKHYCNLEMDKSYQLADWRIRPLPENFIDYARKDTHYLLYIYDKMRNQLIQKGASFLKSIYDKTTWKCQQKYLKPLVDESTVMNIYRKSKHVFDQRQLFAFREILLWRDKIARFEDESPGYVLPQHMALDISSKLPREMQGILACCTPIPSLVRQHLHTIHQIILKAREVPVTKALMSPQQQQQDQRHKMQSNFDLNNPLYCPHDTTQDVQNNLPTLLTDPGKVGGKRPAKRLIKEKPHLDVFKVAQNSGFSSRLNMLTGGSIMDNIKLAKLVEMECNLKVADLESSPMRKLGYKERKFNTPYQRHVETCKNKYINECNEVIPSNSVQAADDEQQVENSVVEEIKPQIVDRKESIYSETVPLKAMKNKRKNEEKEAGTSQKKVKQFEIKKELQVKPIENVDEEKDDEDNTNQSKNQNRNKKKNKFKKNNKVSNKSFRQTSNKPIPFDYEKVDYSRFQGGSQQSQSNQNTNKKNGKKGERKGFHPNSKMAKSIGKVQKMFNFSSNNLKKN